MNPRRIPFLNSTTLATLLSAFLRVKLNGGVLDVYESFLGSNRKAAHSVQDQENSLKRLKVVKDAFNLVVDVLENEIVLLQEACLPVTMKRGMQSLPDDLLREIFELATEEYEFSMPKDPELPMKLANVNRRFRSVALRTPSLWSKLTNDLKLGQLKIYISRSRVSGLSIYIMSNSSDDVGLHLPLRKFFEMTTEHKNRWTHLFFGSSNTEGGYSHPAFRGFQGLFLPGLTSLCWEKYDYDRTADPHPTIAPFSTWIMPNLTQFEGLGVMVDITTFLSNYGAILHAEVPQF
ncbi:hypothetical protein BD410DRAFT_636185 [Rickenella mellea]|uniref:F-box domain-containing protein n=1 Tax=Rickenella mellea TaxID=50990 RepID=A0A4Y7QDB5_9AGAM|nr:hypothetical protein BD410DRAFT_636185 [Rickenella mellea]